ncbi:DnaD domain protein [Caproiciproducens galactitolivorans]|uniref:Replication initiation and membrane attachment n=1 Tax=Caproiciproducens galactitolivorans TaxID=642589 RepID=A0A4Z0Y1V5_9FIRM|nr:DnaD domain protein [Caproiciproducens galactitolivorans]QEY34530.1 DnaD domain protein [Caproiciproducens galactitolivorans]TGJ77684.1 replication initiation and membrane attachment [Caproiciproducens galactitolivorans]
MSCSINLGEWNSIFAVPCSVVDKHIKLAGSVQLKVLLWELRHAGERFDAADIAKALGIDRADVSDAMLYWQQTGLFAEKDGEFVPAGGTSEAETTKTAEEAPAAKPTQAPEKPKRILSRPQKPDNAFVAKRIAESKEIACLMQEAEQILGRLISNGDSAMLLMLHDHYGLPCDVIIMLLQYAVSIGKANSRYIEKVAMNWADEEIFTHEKAEEKLRRLDESKKAWHAVEQAIGIMHRAPSSKEQAFASVWINEWKFNTALIHEAYERSVDNTGKFSPSYMNKILERWHKEGISTLEQAQKDKEERAAARKGGRKPITTYDIEEYERSGVFDNFDRK